MTTPINGGVRFTWHLDYFELSPNSYQPDNLIESHQFAFNGAKFSIRIEPKQLYIEELRNFESAFNNRGYLCVNDFGQHQELKLRRRIWLEDGEGRMISLASEGEQRFVKADYKWKSNGFGVHEDAFEETERYGFPYELTLFCELYYDEEHADQKANAWRQKIDEFSETGIIGRCTLRVDGKDFLIAKQLLMMESEVFERMFKSGSTEATTGIVEIKDIRAEVVQSLIAYLNTGKVDLENHSEELFVVSDKYVMKELQDKCIEHLVKTLNNDNCLRRLIMAFTYVSPEFREKIVKRISTRGSVVYFMKLIKTEEWKKFSVENHQSSNEIIDAVCKKI